MFDDQSNNSIQGAGDSAAAAPSLGLGINPNPSFVAPTTSAPTPPPVTPSEEDQRPAPEATDAPVPTAITNLSSLEDIKVQALSQLSPLVNQLEQTPEEKYKTIMMMIQASDNQELITEAYAAAQNITDEKVKAEALLNIVNEINYFTQQHAN